MASKVLRPQLRALNTRELQAPIPGRVLLGPVASYVARQESFFRNGNYELEEHQLRVYGSYKVINGELCTEVPNYQRATQCRALLRDSSGSYYAREVSPTFGARNIPVKVACIDPRREPLNAQNEGGCRVP